MRVNLIDQRQTAGHRPCEEFSQGSSRISRTDEAGGGLSRWSRLLRQFLRGFFERMHGLGILHREFQGADSPLTPGSLTAPL
jgi:hypothetical protein